MDASSVDHKDHPGDYREQIQSNVFQRVGATGTRVTSRETLIGNWRVDFVGMQGEREHAFVYRLLENGERIVQMPGQPPSTGDRWELNTDGSVSFFTWCAAMPEFGIPEPTHDEERMRIAALPDGRFVTWNGDGSLTMLFSPG